MGKKYTLRILPSEEFDKLPYPRIQENPTHVYGVSDPKTGIAFVRDTGYNDFTKATMEHELDELMAKTSPHEEDGIRYKDFSQAFGNFGSNVPVIGKVLGPVLGAVGQVPDLLGAGISKVGGMFGGGGTSTPTTSNFLSQVAQGRGVGVVPQGNPVLSAFNPITNITSKLPSMTAQAVQGMTSPFTPVKPAAATTTTPATGFLKTLGTDILKGIQGTATGEPATGTSIGTTLGKAAPGTLVSLLGNLFAPKTSAIDVSGISNALKTQVTQGTGPLYQEALNVGRQTLTTPVGEPNEEQFRAVDRQIDEALAKNIEELRNTFKSLNPNADVEGNTRFAQEKARLLRDATQLKAEARGNAVAQQIQDQLRTMEDFLNIDSAQTQQLMQIAQLDIESIIANTGLSAQEATEFKQLFGNIGELMIKSQFPQPAITKQTVGGA